MASVVTDSDSNVRSLSAPKVPLKMNAQVEATLDILRGEARAPLHARRDDVDDRTAPRARPASEVGGATAKGSFARALAERCFDGDRLDALVDVILLERREVDPRIRDIHALLAREDFAAGKTVGPFTIERKIGESAHAVVYQAQRDDGLCTLKVLRREASRDRRAVHRFLTANRAIATVAHAGLARKIEAGELPDGTPWIAYEWIEGQTLAARFAKSGPSHVNELKELLRGILEPLAALHKAGLTHGDLKLENILVARAARPVDRTDARVVLIDAGTDGLRPRAVTGPGGHDRGRNSGFTRDVRLGKDDGARDRARKGGGRPEADVAAPSARSCSSSSSASPPVRGGEPDRRHRRPLDRRAGVPERARPPRVGYARHRRLRRAVCSRRTPRSARA